MSDRPPQPTPPTPSRPRPQKDAAVKALGKKLKRPEDIPVSETATDRLAQVAEANAPGGATRAFSGLPADWSPSDTDSNQE